MMMILIWEESTVKVVVQFCFVLFLILKILMASRMSDVVSRAVMSYSLVTLLPTFQRYVGI
jgi:hypothetical protein